MNAAYSKRAAEYSHLFGTIEAAHPSDRCLVETWASSLNGRVVDAGCGPGHWTHHVASLGVDIRGIDFVPEFIKRAQQTYPERTFGIESIEALNEPDGALGGVLSWFSTIHHDAASIALPMNEFARALRPGGTLLVGFFVGQVTEPFDHAVTPAWRWSPEALCAVLQSAGLEPVEIHRRAEQGQRPVGAILAQRSSP